MSLFFSIQFSTILLPSQGKIDSSGRAFDGSTLGQLAYENASAQHVPCVPPPPPRASRGSDPPDTHTHTNVHARAPSRLGCARALEWCAVGVLACPRHVVVVLLRGTHPVPFAYALVPILYAASMSLPTVLFFPGHFAAFNCVQSLHGRLATPMQGKPFLYIGHHKLEASLDAMPWDRLLAARDDNMSRVQCLRTLQTPCVTASVVVCAVHRATWSN